jgi:hypothetical protein
MAETTGGLAQDVLTRIVNVHWGGGLAVEFTKEPSYLTLKQALSSLSMTKVVISVWFRIPKESADAVREAIIPGFGYSVFDGVIPLVVWGKQPTTPVTEVESYDSGSIDSSANIIMLERISGSHTAPLQPSCIGFYVGNASINPSLHVHIQTDVNASGTGLLFINTRFTGDFIGINTTPPHVGYPVYNNVKYIKEDVSYAVTEEPEYLGNIGSGAGYPDVKEDQWNHLLISWELVGGGGNKMWCAINDKNKDGNDLPALCDLSTMGPNEHSSSTPYYNGGKGKFVSVPDFGPTNVPSDPVQTPGPPSANRSSDDIGGTIPIAPIQKVELAELQIFTGITLNTSIESNRRAFIDFERDEDGNPIRNDEGKRTLRPVNPEQAEELLRKKPEVLLHGSSDWIDGQNTGSTGINYGVDPPQIKPDGQFKPTGKITAYTPDPGFVEA